jgi:hypothetical protein
MPPGLRRAAASPRLEPQGPMEVPAMPSLRRTRPQQFSFQRLRRFALPYEARAPSSSPLFPRGPPSREDGIQREELSLTRSLEEGFIVCSNRVTKGCPKILTMPRFLHGTAPTCRRSCPSAGACP